MSREAVLLSELGIERPTLIVDRARAIHNIERMIGRAASMGVGLRPHFKTHQSRDIGRWFRARGVTAIAVSSVRMARYFAGDGWSDITIAAPVNLMELGDIAELSERLKLGVLVDSVGVVEQLARLGASGIRVWIKTDTGYGRAGVAWDDEELLSGVAGAVLGTAGLELAGLLTHNGLTYGERGAAGVLRAHREAMERLDASRAFVSSLCGWECATSIGDTPSASLVDEMSGVDELRPGNFVFCDLMQAAIGSCSVDDIAVAVACPVIGVYPRRKRVVLYGGAVHLSAESMEDGTGRRIYGLVGTDWPIGPSDSAPVISLSQEHAVVDTTDRESPHFRQGQLALVLPVHSCLTCDLHAEYVTLDGERLSTMRGWSDRRGDENATGGL